MAALGVRTGASLVVSSDGAASASRVADVLGTLRGLSAKVGQMASYVDGIIPEEHRQTYETSLRVLRAQAPRSSSAEIRSLIEEELGAPMDRLFLSFDEAPIASASIGQVHRATLHDGRAVAIKVQHPGIARAVESDLANAGVLESMGGFLAGKRFQTKEMLDVVVRRFREELDYQHEADNIAFFRSVHAEDALIEIPSAISAHSSKRVLTMDFAEGLDFETACAASEDERRAWAETMWRFVFRGNLLGGRFNADPHPGNYLFRPGGRVVFLDHGCVQPIGDDRRAHAQAVHRAAIDRDEAGFGKALMAMLHGRPGRVADMAISYTRLCFEPLFSSPYRITRPYSASLVESMKTMGMAARKIKGDEFFTMPPEMLFMNRLQFGFYSVLARLDVEVDYASLEREFLPRA